MPYARPGFTDLLAQAKSAVTTGIPGADGLLRRSVLGVLAKVQAMFANGFYGYLDWIAQEAVPFTSDAEYLEAWGALVGITRKGQTTASGTATFTGNNGALIPSGTGLSRADGGAYTTTADGTVAGGTVAVPVVSTLPGTTGNADAGTQVSLSAGILGVLPQGTVAAYGGEPVEADAQFRPRVLQQYAAPPHGGDLSDYLEWAETVPGVTRAWVLPHAMGPGTVSIYSMWDANGFGGFPQGTSGCATGEDRDVTATGDLLAVANAVFPVQPVTALVYSVVPVAYPIVVNINDLVLPTNGAALIAAALNDVLLRKANPLGLPLYPSDIEEAIAAVPGVGSFTLGAPLVPVAAPVGRIITVGNIVYGVTGG